MSCSQFFRTCADVFARTPPENVRMAPHHFRINLLDHVGDIESAAFGGELGVEDDLQQQIAELVGKFSGVGGFERVQNLVSLFN